MRLKFPAEPTPEFAEFSQKAESFPVMGVSNFSEDPDHPSTRRGPGPSESSYCPPPPPSSSSSCSSSVLSEISLGLCTENLGNETGCMDTEETNLLSSIPYPPRSDQASSSARRFTEKKRASPRTFPPPLTTIIRSESIHFRPRREDGRLVIEAVRIPPAYGSLQAVRSHGRLRLRFLEETAPASDPEHFDCQEGALEEGFEGECLCREEEEEVVVEDGEECAHGWGGDADEKNENFGGRMEGVETFARTGGRCTEGGNAKSKSGSLDWGPYLVATS